MVIKMNGSNWLEVDIIGLRKTLERKGKAWAIFELVQNAWDEDATEVRVTLSSPVNGKSTLTCTDNSSKGYADLSAAHKMFAESYKKSDAEKRGRFNCGEKYVLCLCDEATITSTSGQVVFAANGSRTKGDNKTTAGSVFEGILGMSASDYEDVCKQVQLLIPPITTTFNGVPISKRTPIRTFDVVLPTEVADAEGVLRARKRETEVRVFKVKAGEKAVLYERGIPVVAINSKWSVDISQKVPLNIERDNVTPGYLKAVYVAVLDVMVNALASGEASAPWVSTAFTGAKPETIVKVMDGRFGKNRVSVTPDDPQSVKEATSQGFVVVPSGALPKEAWEAVRKAKAIVPSGQMFPTKEKINIEGLIDPEDYDEHQRAYVSLIENVSPHLLPNHKVFVQIINNEKLKIYGCSQWKEDSYIFTINVAHHNCEDEVQNNELLIHEAAHHLLQNNDHLRSDFYETCTTLGAKLAQLALDRPELFETVREEVEDVAA